MDIGLELKHDFGVFDTVDVTEINGKNYMGVDGKLLNSSTTITESEFANKWLHQFAVGWVGGKCYFQLEEWKGFTNGGKESVVVVDDVGKSLFVVKPLADVNLTPDELSAVRLAGENLTRISQTPNGILSKKIFQKNAEYLKNAITAKPSTYADTIPEFMYAKYGLIPWVMKRVVYIRDAFKYDPDSETINYVQKILTKSYKKEKLTATDIEFMLMATHNTLDLSDSEVVDKQIVNTGDDGWDLDE